MRIGGDFHHQSVPVVFIKTVLVCLPVFCNWVFPEVFSQRWWSILLVDSERSKEQIFLLSKAQYFDLAIMWGFFCLFGLFVFCFNLCFLVTHCILTKWMFKKCLKEVFHIYSDKQLLSHQRCPSWIRQR